MSQTFNSARFYFATSSADNFLLTSLANQLPIWFESPIRFDSIQKTICRFDSINNFDSIRLKYFVVYPGHISPNIRVTVKINFRAPRSISGISSPEIPNSTNKSFDRVSENNIFKFRIPKLNFSLFSFFTFIVSSTITLLRVELYPEIDHNLNQENILALYS